MKKQSCVTHAQNVFTTNDHNKFKIIKIEQDLNEHNNYII